MHCFNVTEANYWTWLKRYMITTTPQPVFLHAHFNTATWSVDDIAWDKKICFGMLRRQEIGKCYELQKYVKPIICENHWNLWMQYEVWGTQWLKWTLLSSGTWHYTIWCKCMNDEGYLLSPSGGQMNETSILLMEVTRPSVNVTSTRLNSTTSCDTVIFIWTNKACTEHAAPCCKQVGIQPSHLPSNQPVSPVSCLYQ